MPEPGDERRRGESNSHETDRRLTRFSGPVPSPTLGWLLLARAAPGIRTLNLPVLNRTPLPLGQSGMTWARSPTWNVRSAGFEPAPPAPRAGASTGWATSVWSRRPVPTRATRLTKARSQAVCGGGAPWQGFEPQSRDSEPRVLPLDDQGRSDTSTSARTRTWGLPLRKRALSPLSYRGRARRVNAARKTVFRCGVVNSRVPAGKEGDEAWAAGVEPASRRCWKPAAYPLAHP